MTTIVLKKQVVPEEMTEWLSQSGGPLLAAIEQDAEGRVVIEPLPDVDPLVVPRVLKSMAQYAEVLRRLA